MLATSHAKLVIFAGATGASILHDGDELTDFHVLDLQTRAWSRPQLTLLGGTPSPSEWTGRCLSATHIGGDRFLTFGGSAETSDAVAIIDASVSRNKRASSQGVASRDALEDEVGTRGDSQVPMGTDSLNDGIDVDAFEISLEAITLVPLSETIGGRVRRETPMPRYNHTAVRVGNRIHFYGGWARGRPLRDHLCLELARGDDIALDGQIAERWRRNLDPWMVMSTEQHQQQLNRERRRQLRVEVVPELWRILGLI